MLQAHVDAVYYLHDWSHPDPDPERQAEYDRLQARFPGGIHRFEMADPEADWAVSARREVGSSLRDGTGHET
jgi:dCMP deaminase